MTNLTLYRQVAKDALMKWYGYTDENALQRVLSEDFDELETNAKNGYNEGVWAIDSINDAVDAIADLLDFNGEERETLREASFAKDRVEMSKEDEKVFKKVGEAAIGLEEKSILYISSRVHDGWVRREWKKFNKEGREQKRYQHLPLELIGFKEVEADLLFFKPILEAIGVEIDMDSLKKEYDKSVVKFLETKGISSKEDLVGKILKGNEFYKPLNENQVAQSREVAEAMVNQVMSVNRAAKEVLDGKSLG